MTTQNKPPPDIRLVQPEHLDCDKCNVEEHCLGVGLDSAIAASLSQVSKTLGPFLEGDVFTYRGDTLSSLYIVQYGALRSETNTYAGARRVKCFYFPGDLVGMEAMATKTWPCDIVAIQPTWMCQIPCSELSKIAQNYPQLSESMFARFSQRILEQEFSITKDPCEKSATRLLEYLLNLHRRLKGTEYVDGSMIKLPMIKSDLASYLDITPETLSRTLSQLAKIGLVSNHKKGIKIHDRAQIEEILQAAQG